MEHPSLPAFGQLNPEAPSELLRFAFLIGRWTCDVSLQSPDGASHHYEAAWEGRFFLDGYAIADEYRMTDPSGRLVVLGMNFRTYDAANAVWNIKWLDALTGAWVDLTSEEFGGVQFEGDAISYAFREPVAEHRYTRATYTTLSGDRFTWRGDMSDDGETWSEFMLAEATRIE